MSVRAQQHSATVLRRERLADHLLRLTLGGEGLAGFTSTGVPDCSWVNGRARWELSSITRRTSGSPTDTVWPSLAKTSSTEPSSGEVISKTLFNDCTRGFWADSERGTASTIAMAATRVSLVMIRIL